MYNCSAFLDLVKLKLWASCIWHLRFSTWRKLDCVELWDCTVLKAQLFFVSEQFWGCGGLFLSGPKVFWFICRTRLFLWSIKSAVCNEAVKTSYIKGIFVYATRIHSSPRHTPLQSILEKCLPCLLLVCTKWQLQGMKLLTFTFRTSPSMVFWPLITKANFHKLYTLFRIKLVLAENW